MDPLLPQHDSDPSRRSDYLDRQRDLYRYDYEILPPLAILEKLPKEEKFSFRYLAKRDPKLLKIAASMGVDAVRKIFDPFNKSKPSIKILEGARHFPSDLWVIQSFNFFL